MAIKFTVITLALMMVMAIGVRADGISVMDNLEEHGGLSLDGFRDIIPASAADIGNDAGEVARDFTVGRVVDMITSELAELASPLTRQLSILLGVVIITSAVNAAKNSISSGSLTTALEYLTLLCAVLAAYGTISGVWQRIADTLTDLNTFMIGLIPMMGSLYVAGGNVTTAAVSSAGLMTLTAFCEQLSYYVLWPVLRVCFGLSLITGLGGQVSLSGVSQTLRNMFTTALSFIMTVLTFVISNQVNLALSADNVTAKALKFAASNYIPVVGGALGDAIRAIGGSIGVLRSTLGTAAVAVIFAIVLPAVLQIYLCRFAFSITASVAKLAGCDKEGSVFEEMRGMLGFGLAILMSCAVMFLFFVSSFSRAAVGLLSQ
ncbi:MAG TPA: hypothetical protein GXX22_08005 [Clostridiales bacterium]|nr:hypothetical protein [Clostridiales bacterium]